MVDVKKLKGKICEAGLTIPGIARRMNISPSTLYRKLKHNGEWLLVKDVDKIIDIVDIQGDDVNAIFYSVGRITCD